jgi:3-oxoacyl-[acyl-carrier protein] reductase
MMFAGCFDGQSVLVTGSSTGIGAAAARLLAESGAAVGVHFNRSEGAARELLSQIQAKGAQGALFQADLSKRGESERLVEGFVKRFGALHHLVNNAGALVKRSPVAEVADDLLEETVAVNFYSTVRTSRAAVPHLRATRGSIVNVSSIAIRNGGGPGAGVYAATKAAVGVLTIALAKELAPAGVRVNAVAPGVIETPFHRKYSTPEQMKRFASATPLARNGTPEEVAYAIVYLLSPAASFITGETIDVNGGLFMHA